MPPSLPHRVKNASSCKRFSWLGCKLCTPRPSRLIALRGEQGTETRVAFLRISKCLLEREWEKPMLHLGLMYLCPLFPLPLLLMPQAAGPQAAT